VRWTSDTPRRACWRASTTGNDASLGVWGVGQPETVCAGTRFNRHALLARQTGRYDADDMAKGLSIYTYIHSHESVG